MPDSRMRRAAQALRDPWSLLAAAVGAGAAWALALPIGGIGAVGVGMLGVAAVVGAVSSRAAGPAAAPLPPALVPGTAQFRLVGTLDSYLADLIRLQAGPSGPVLATQAADAVEAARSAHQVALGVAVSVDALDAALEQARQVARQMTSSDKVAGPLDRMRTRRKGLLARLTAAVDGVGELYTKLLELSANPDVTVGAATDAGPDPVAEVNDSLDAIRGAFAELESAARSATAGLGS